MKIIVDAFGGDNAPLEIIKGCAEAVQEHGVEVILTGSKTAITEALYKGTKRNVESEADPKNAQVG